VLLCYPIDSKAAFENL